MTRRRKIYLVPPPLFWGAGKYGSKTDSGVKGSSCRRNSRFCQNSRRNESRWGVKLGAAAAAMSAAAAAAVTGSKKDESDASKQPAK